MIIDVSDHEETMKDAQNIILKPFTQFSYNLFHHTVVAKKSEEGWLAWG